MLQWAKSNGLNNLVFLPGELHHIASPGRTAIVCLGEIFTIPIPKKTFLQVYAPTDQASQEEEKAFFMQLDKTFKVDLTRIDPKTKHEIILHVGNEIIEAV